MSPSDDKLKRTDSDVDHNDDTDDTLDADLDIEPGDENSGGVSNGEKLSGWVSLDGSRYPVSACVEPMDYVFLWVNGSDPVVSAARARVLEQAKQAADNARATNE